MANVKITELSPAFTPLWGTELIEIVQGGVNKQVEVNEVGGGGGVTKFIELTDVPASYTGQGSKVVAVKADESGLEFVAGGGTTPTLQEVTDEGATTSNPITITDGLNATFLSTGEILLYDSGGNETGVYANQVNVSNGTSRASISGSGLIQLGKSGTETINIYSNNLTDIREVEMPDYDGTLTTEEWVIANVSGGAVDSVNGQTGVVVLDSDDINEGATNLYFTDARALGAIPDATPTVKGIAKLYTSLGSNTDGAVDQNTVNSALALKANLQNVEQIIRSKANGTFGSHTGDTAETVIEVIDIDAGEYEIGDFLTLMYSAEKDAGVGNVIYKVRVGVNGDTSDSLIASLTANAANSRNAGLRRERLQFITGNLLKTACSVSGSIASDMTTSGAGSSISIDPSNAWKITFTAQLTVSTETASLTGYRIGKIKSF